MGTQNSALTTQIAALMADETQEEAAITALLTYTQGLGTQIANLNATITALQNQGGAPTADDLANLANLASKMQADTTSLVTAVPQAAPPPATAPASPNAPNTAPKPTS